MDVLSALEELIRAPPTKRDKNGFRYYEATERAEWLTRAHTILAGTFPAAHSVMKNFNDAAEKAAPESAAANFDRVYGVVKGAAYLIRNGQHRSFIEGIRTETVDEVLSQAA